MQRTASRIEPGPLNFLHRSAAVMADRTAVVHGDRRYAYSEPTERTGRLASALRAAGVERDDRVAVLCPNSPAILDAHDGVPAAGGILVTINTRLSAGEIEHILSDCTPRVAIVDTELSHLVDAPDVETVIVEDTGAPPRSKSPAAIELGELPRTSTNKVQKLLLREREWAGREKASH